MFLIVVEYWCEVNVRVLLHMTADPLAHSHVEGLQLLQVLSLTTITAAAAARRHDSI
jgi:hypothetical protein